MYEIAYRGGLKASMKESVKVSEVERRRRGVPVVDGHLTEELVSFMAAALELQGH